MGLIAWWPLDGSTVNQGLESITLTSGTAIYSNGKIGQCLNSGTLRYSCRKDLVKEMTTSNTYSMAFWIKLTNAATGNWVVRIFGDNAAGNSRGLWHSTNATLAHWAYGGSGYNISHTKQIYDSKWHHICFVINKTNVKIYIDGVADGEINTNKTDVINLGSSNIEISSSVTQLNDVRIYNHCLSAREVSEISQGLILHYPMMMPNGIIGGENLALLTKDSVKLTGTNSSNQCPTPYYMSKSWADLNGKKVTLSFDYEYSNGATADRASIGLDASNWNRWVSFPAMNKKGHASGTATISSTSTTTGIQCRFDNFVGSVTISNLKLEIGTISTPWTPASSDVPLWDNKTVYDASGYRHNATYTSESKPGFDSNSPVGLGSYKFTTSSHLLVPKNSFYGRTVNEITIAGWAKWDDGSEGIHLLTLGGNSGLRLSVGKGGNVIWSYASGVYTRNNSVTKNKWYHVALTFKDGIWKAYIDGKLDNTTDNSGISKTISFNRDYDYEWLINGYATTSEKGVGNLCDVRVYATALSAEDIERLYKVRTTIDNYGNLLTTSLIESFSIANSSLTKSGLVKTNSLTEDGDTGKIFKDGSVKATKFYEFI